MNDSNSSSSNTPHEQTKLNEYTPPSLTLFGTVNELTKSGTNGSVEGSAPLPTKRS